MSWTMRLDPENASRLLRRDGVGRCKYCGELMEWFDSYDHKRLPLTSEVPGGQVPAKYRWHVGRGVAYTGADPVSGYCRIPHPAVCPAVEHHDLPPQLAAVVDMFRLRMRKRIVDEGFVPHAVAPTEEEVREPDTPGAEDADSGRKRVRHLLHHGGDLRLAPCTIDQIRCVATDEVTQDRCDRPVYEAGDGKWEQIPIPHAPGRAGQTILSSHGGLMWVYSVEAFEVLRRWRCQHCPSHEGFSVAADHMPNEWVTFNALRHADFISGRRPAGYDVAEDAGELRESPVKRTGCAGESCSNGTVVPVGEDWLCWRCEKQAARRRRVHQKHTPSARSPRPGP